MSITCFGRELEAGTNILEMKKGNGVLSWDTLAVTDSEVEALKEDWELRFPDAEVCPPEDVIRQDVIEDVDFFQWQHDEMTNELSEVMQSINPDSNDWNTKVINFGWRNLEGTKSFSAENGAELLREILPDCECTFYIHIYEENGKTGLAINNYHHDSPMGEWYYIFPV